MAPCVTLHLTIISAEGLKDINYITKMRTYVEVSIVGGTQAHKQRTLTDMDGGTSPTWNCPMSFTFDGEAALQDRLTLVMMIRTKSLIGDRDVASVRYPLMQMIRTYVTNSPAPAVESATSLSGGGLKFSYQFEIGTGTAPMSYGQPSYNQSSSLFKLAANTTVVVGKIALFLVQAAGN